MSTPIDQLPQPTQIDYEEEDLHIRQNPTHIYQEIRRKVEEKSLVESITDVLLNKEFLLLLLFLFVSNIETTNTYLRMVPGINSIHNSTIRVFLKCLAFAVLFWAIKVYFL